MLVQSLIVLERDGGTRGMDAMWGLKLNGLSVLVGRNAVASIKRVVVGYRFARFIRLVAWLPQHNGCGRHHFFVIRMIHLVLIYL